MRASPQKFCSSHEGKANTFTVGGASMLGLFLAPMIIDGINLVLNWTGRGALPAAAVLAALSVAYAFGEGRELACLSFGVLFSSAGKWSTAVGMVPAVSHRIRRQNEEKLPMRVICAVPLIPIQALTAVMSVGAGITGVWLFLQGTWPLASRAPRSTQLWRVASEYLRADFRGVGDALVVSNPLAIRRALCFRPHILAGYLPPAFRNMRLGLRDIWSPGSFSPLEALWLGIFFFTGRS